MRFNKLCFLSVLVTLIWLLKANSAGFSIPEEIYRFTKIRIECTFSLSEIPARIRHHLEISRKVVKSYLTYSHSMS